MIEIEKKFLVCSSWGNSYSSSSIEQGYLFIEESKSLRVRRHNKDYYLTVKIEKNKDERFEFESQIEKEQGKSLLEKHCLPNIISKFRNVVYLDHRKWEIDVFSGKNQHLIIAEIELNSIDDKFTHPSWLGPEVTQQNRYLNSHLTQKPFCEWEITYENLLIEEIKKSKKKTSASQ